MYVVVNMIGVLRTRPTGICNIYVNVQTSINKQVLCINQSILLGFMTELYKMYVMEHENVKDIMYSST